MPQIDKELCVRCGGCLSGYDGSNGCMYGAITMDDKSVNIDTDKCKNCGKCIKLCGLGAISE